jgi:6-pyruvoyltetrahydropterin/6-carboxytetrahydropterin synthase
MAVDFKEAKGLLESMLEKFDHSYLNETGVFKRLNPTSENMAKSIYDGIKKNNRHIASVSVWENENSCATYRAVIARAR